MCPNTELLSAYYDSELDRVWESRIAEHVSHCSVCQARLSHFDRLSSELKSLDEPDFAASMARSWEIIQSRRSAKTVPFWKRRVSIPVPILASAAAVVVAVFGLGIYLNFSAGRQQQVATPITMQQTDVSPVDFQVNNLNDLLNYLNSKDLGTTITIQLPKGVNQLSVGKPQLIRAADYNRGQ